MFCPQGLRSAERNHLMRDPKRGRFHRIACHRLDWVVQFVMLLSSSLCAAPRLLLALSSSPSIRLPCCRRPHVRALPSPSPRTASALPLKRGLGPSRRGPHPGPGPRSRSPYHIPERCDTYARPPGAIVGSTRRRPPRAIRRAQCSRASAHGRGAARCRSSHARAGGAGGGRGPTRRRRRLVRTAGASPSHTSCAPFGRSSRRGCPSAMDAPSVAGASEARRPPLQRTPGEGAIAQILSVQPIQGLMTVSSARRPSEEMHAVS